MGVKKTNTTAYYPQSDGFIENFNRTLRAMIAKHAKKFGRDLDSYLPQLLFVYQTKPHECTGESPFYLLYGYDARLPTEVALSTPKPPYVVSIDNYKTVGYGFNWVMETSQK